MQPPKQHSRINLAELKAQIIKRLGPERSKQYFFYLNKLVSLKLSKVEFNKLCFRVLGSENVRLHNLFIHSILKNACHARIPPPPVTTDDSYQKNEDTLLSPQNVSSKASTGPTVTVDSTSHESTVTNENLVSENGNLTSHDTWKPVQHHQEVSRIADSGGEVLLRYPTKLPLTKGLADGFPSVDSREESEVFSFEDGKELPARNSIQAPLGIPFGSRGLSAACRGFDLARSGRFANSYDCGRLLDTKALQERMQQIAEVEGLDGMSIDCANLLNNGLDVYLKRLIRPCIELVGSRYGRDSRHNNILKHHSHVKLVNGFLLSHHLQVQDSCRNLEMMQEQRSYIPISLLDFKVAMELNPHELGEDWPLLLEKIWMRSLEE